MLFIVIEHFKNQNAKAVYQRAQERGRMLPAGLEYIDSWAEATYDRCFQLMQSNDPNLFQDWTAQWQDLVEFEIVPVMTSAEAKAIALDPQR